MMVDYAREHANAHLLVNVNNANGALSLAIADS